MILEEVVNKFLRDITNLAVVQSGFAIKAQQQGNRPLGPYATVNVLLETPIGQEHRSLENNIDDEDLTETTQGLIEIMVSINFFRDSAFDKAKALRAFLIRESTAQLFRSANLGLVRRSEIRNISEPLESGFEKRAQLDIMLSAVEEDANLITSISMVSIGVEYQVRKLSYNFTIEVPSS